MSATRYLSLALLIAPLGVVLAQSPHAPEYHWERLDDREWGLRRSSDNAWLGNLLDGEYYRRSASGEWDKEPSECPAAPPSGVVLPRKPRCGCCSGCACKQDRCGCSDKKRCCKDCKCSKTIGGDELPGVIGSDGKPNYGIDESKFPRGQEHIVNGREVSREQLLEAIGAAPVLPNDAGFLCVTAIGAKAFQDQVTQDFATAPALAGWKSRVKLKSFDPSHWAVAGVGFVAPSVYIQSPSGQVLYRWDEYPGAEALAEELRILDPNYRPEHDPGPGRLGGSLSDAIAWLLGSLASLFCFGSFALFVLAGLWLLIRHLRQRGPESEV